MVNVLYSKTNCEWCRRLIHELWERGVPFTEVKVDADIQNMAELMNRVPGVRTVPQFFVDDKHVGGYEDAMVYIDERFPRLTTD